MRERVGSSAASHSTRPQTGSGSLSYQTAHWREAAATSVSSSSPGRNEWLPPAKKKKKSVTVIHFVVAGLSRFSCCHKGCIVCWQWETKAKVEPLGSPVSLLGASHALKVSTVAADRPSLAATVPRGFATFALVVSTASQSAGLATRPPPPYQSRWCHHLSFDYNNKLASLLISCLDCNKNA